MSLKVTDSGPPIVQPSTCFKNLLLNLKVLSVASFINNLLKISFGQIGVNFFMNINLNNDIVNPSTSLGTKLTDINGAYKFNVYQKNTKLHSPWTSKTPKHYKRKTINGDLHCSKRISSNFDKEKPLMKEKFMKADYPLRFINSVVNEFQKGKECGDESFIIPPTLFEIAKPFILVETPYCELNEIKSKYF